MRIAVISDTHDRIPATLPGLLSEADEIWHLGDVCNPIVLDQIRAIGPRVTIVRGNCDSNFEWPLVRNLERKGVRAHLVHIPPCETVEGSDLVLHGHTHVPRDETIGETRFLNPGCISLANRGAPPSFAWLEIGPGKALQWTLQVLPRRRWFR
jgi:putative phosphoesterase